MVGRTRRSSGLCCAVTELSVVGSFFIPISGWFLSDLKWVLTVLTFFLVWIRRGDQPVMGSARLYIVR